MRSTSLLGTIPKALYSADIYQEVAREWRGFGFLYMLLLLTVIAVPLTIASMSYVSGVTLKKPFDIEYIINQVPVLQINSGKVTTNVAMPYYIKNKAGKTLGVIDTTRPVTDWADRMDEHKIFFVLGKERALLKKSSRTHEKRLYEIPDDMDEIINSAYLRSMTIAIIDNLWKIVLVVAVFLFLFSYLLGLITLFIYGAIGKVMNVFLKTDLLYNDFVRLSAVASTASAFFALLLLIGIHVSMWVYIIVDIVYLFFAIKVNK